MINKFCTDLKRLVCSYLSLQDIRQLKLVSKVWYIIFQEDYTWYLLCKRMGYIKILPKPGLEQIKQTKGFKWLYLSKVYSTHTGCFVGANVGGKVIECVRKHSHTRCRCNIYKPYCIGYENYVNESESAYRCVTRYEGDWNMSTRCGFGMLTVYKRGVLYIGEFKNGKQCGKGSVYLTQHPKHFVKNNEIVFVWDDWDKKINDQVHYGMFPLPFAFSIEGTWRDNKLHGFCKITNLKKQSTQKRPQKRFYFNNKKWE